MEITARFDNLEEMWAFAGFITAPNVPAQEASQQMGADPSGQPAAPAQPVTPPAPAAQPLARPAPAASAQQPVQTPPVPAQRAQPAVPTTAPAYTLEDLGRAGVAVQEMGKDAEVRALVASFGVATLQELPEAQYGAFATALRSLGAPI